MSELRDDNFLFSPDQGHILVALARKTITERLGRKVSVEIETKLNENLTAPEFQTCAGTFVTLTVNNNLRGCIGSLAAVDSVVDGIKKNSINAAFNDYRFSKLEEGELDNIAVEISVLSQPEPLDYENWVDLVNTLRVGVDGVIIKKGAASATFLPQVWEQLPKVEDFLSRLCGKAGLNADAWKTDKLEVSTYQVQHFTE